MNRIFTFLFSSLVAFGANAKELECSFYEATDEQSGEKKDTVVFDYDNRKNGLKVSSQLIFNKFNRWTVMAVEHSRQRVIAYSKRRIPAGSVEFPVLVVEIDYANNALIYSYFGGHSNTEVSKTDDHNLVHDCKRLD